LGKLPVSQSPQLAAANTKSPPGLLAFVAFVYTVTAAVRPDRGQFTQNKCLRVATRCIGTVGNIFGEIIGLPEPPAGRGQYKVTHGAACFCRLRLPGYCRCEARSRSIHAELMPQSRHIMYRDCGSHLWGNYRPPRAPSWPRPIQSHPRGCLLLPPSSIRLLPL